MKEDLPQLAGRARARYPGTKIELEAAIGEQSAVIEAIAAVIAARQRGT